MDEVEILYQRQIKYIKNCAVQNFKYSKLQKKHVSRYELTVIP